MFDLGTVLIQLADHFFGILLFWSWSSYISNHLSKKLIKIRHFFCMLAFDVGISIFVIIKPQVNQMVRVIPAFQKFSKTHLMCFNRKRKSDLLKVNTVNITNLLSNLEIM